LLIGGTETTNAACLPVVETISDVATAVRRLDTAVRPG
jgi:hypothetical protein